MKKCSKNCCKETDTNCARVCVYFGCFVVFIFLNLHAHNESIHRSTCKLNVFYFCKNVLSQLECIQTFTIFTISIRQWNFWVERSMCFCASIFCVLLNFPHFFLPNRKCIGVSECVFYSHCFQLFWLESAYLFENMLHGKSSCTSYSENKSKILKRK